MSDEIKNILEKPNVYSFADECYLYFGDYNKLKYYITNLQQENERLRQQNFNLIEYRDSLIDENREQREDLFDYKSRVEKAVEYIKENEFKASDGEVCYFCNMQVIKDLLNILNGDEEKVAE